MEIHDDHVEDRLVVRLRGRLDGGSAPEVRDHVQAGLDGPARGVLLDMSAISYVSSMGLQALMLAAKSATAKRKQLAMFGATGSVGKVLQVSGFVHIIRTYATQPEALAGEAGAA